VNRPAILLLAASIALAAGPAAAIRKDEDGRKTTAHDLSVDVERIVLPNGLVVLLSPDPSISSVLVWMSFRAGTLYEPPGRSGMAHLVEHLMASGPTPETDYESLLESRRARYFNAATDFETMRFEVVMPPEELPLALWVAADRLGTVPPLLDDALVERNRRVVLQERAQRDVDVPYGLAREQLYLRLFPAPHPLHGGVIGLTDELRRVDAQDVRKFVGQYLVPANATLTIVGRFDPREARKLIEDGLGRLPGGTSASLPPIAPLDFNLVDVREETISREPGVLMGWRFNSVSYDEATALKLGAQLLSIITDGAFGMRLSAGMQQSTAESYFFLHLTVPYDESINAVQNDADGFLRMLTGREMQFDLLRAANLALDRNALFELDSLEGRAGRLTRLEQLFASRLTVSQDYSSHWMLDPVTVHDTARAYLRGPKVVLHARPKNPRAARVERE